MPLHPQDEIACDAQWAAEPFVFDEHDIDADLEHREPTEAEIVLQRFRETLAVGLLRHKLTGIPENRARARKAARLLLQPQAEGV